MRIQIAEPESWARGAADSLNGMVGVVEEIRPAGVPVLLRYLVVFPVRPRPWSANQIPSHSVAGIGADRGVIPRGRDPVPDDRTALHAPLTG